MAVRIKGLKVGDVLQSRDKDRGIYVYLGKYKQILRYFNFKQSEGYLYCKLGAYSFDTIYMAEHAQEYVPAKVRELALTKILLRDFGKFTGKPVVFDAKLGHADLSEISEYINKLAIFRLEKSEA